MGRAVLILQAILIWLVIFQDGLAASPTIPCRDGVEVSKEIDYILVTEKNVHTKRISFEGVGLTIGSFTENTLGTANDYFKCTPLLEKTHYNGNHALEVLKWSGSRFEMTSGEQGQPLNVEEHFVVIRKEVWNCRDLNKKLADIQRVVNEVISTSSVGEVTYYDGVLVERVNYESIDKFSARVKDIKYITSDGKKWRFKGTLCLVEDGNSSTFGIPNFQAHIRDERKESEIENPVLSMQTTHIRDKRKKKPLENPIQVSSSGETLKIGKWMDDTYDRFFGPIRCRRTSEGSQYSYLFTTNVYHVEDSGRQMPLKTRLSEKEFSKYFTIIKREVYSCSRHLANSNNPVYQNYFRIVNEGIGKVPIKTLYHRQEVIDIKSIRIPGGTSVRYKDVMYFNQYWKQGYFAPGQVIMVEDVTASRRNFDQSIDIAYTLTPTTYYRSLIGSQGIDLRVGQFVSADPALEESHSQTVTCTSASLLFEDKMDVFRTVVKAKIYDNGVVSSMIVREDGESNIYRSISTEVLLCKNSALRFLRIVNKMEILVPVRDLETCDGIHIVPKVLEDGQSMSVSITELKYLNETTFKPIKYVGKLEFVKPDLIQTTLDVRKEALILSIEEAVRWNGVGVPLDPYEIFRAYPSESERPYSILHRQPGGDYKIVFDLKPGDFDDKELSELTIATCSFAVPGTEKFLTPFHVQTEDHNVIPVDQTRFSIYFTLLVHEEWMCLGKNSPVQFRRIVNKYEMKPNTPLPIGYINGFTAWLGDYHVEKRDGKMIPIFTEVKYAKIDSTQLLKYREYLLYPEQFKEKKGVGVAKSGSVVITKNRYADILEGDKKEARVEGVSFKYRKAYQNQLSGEGVKVEIGKSLSKAFFPISGLTPSSECSPGGTLPKDYIIPIMVDGKYDTNGSYLEMLGQEVWTCRRIGQNFQFFRVLSYAKILAEKISTIKELLYQDGVTVAWMHNKDNVDASYLSVMEIRYFDLDLKSVVQLPGNEDLKLEGHHDEKWKAVRDTRTKIFKRTNMERILRRTIIQESGEYILYIPITYHRQVDYSSVPFVCERTNIKVSDSKKKALVKEIQFYKYKSDLVFEIFDNKLEGISQLLRNWLNIKMFVQECKRREETIYRVETIFELTKMIMNSENQIEVTRILHHEGVTAVKFLKRVQIREIKFVDTLEDKKQTKVLQFDGLIWVEDPDPNDRKYDLVELSNIRKDTDFYRLDSLAMIKCSTVAPLTTKKGFLLQIGSAWKDEVQVTKDRVFCKQLVPQKKNEHYDLEVYGVKYILMTVNWNKLDFWSKDIFQGQAQDVWVCMRNDEVIFYRVINYMVLPNEIASIFHNEGIQIGYLDLPDGSKNVEVRETKFLHPDMFHVLKYEGELQFVTEQPTIVQRLFPLDYTAAFPKPQFGYRQLAEGGQYWTLGALAALAVRKRTYETQSLAKANDKGVIDRVGFQGVWSVASVDGHDCGGSRVLHVGTPWQRDLDKDADTKGAKLKCMVHEWNEMFNQTYHPRVRELTRDNIYEFDREMFETVFKIMQQTIRICVWSNEENRDIFLLIATKFYVWKEMYAQFAVAFMHDGVAYDLITHTLHETVLINTGNNEYSKYSGDIGLIANPEKIHPKKDANILTRAVHATPIVTRIGLNKLKNVFN